MPPVTKQIISSIPINAPIPPCICELFSFFDEIKTFRRSKAFDALTLFFQKKELKG
jgi:hypothetical protein